MSSSMVPTMYVPRPQGGIRAEARVEGDTAPARTCAAASNEATAPVSTGETLTIPTLHFAADNANTVFKETTVSELMQDIHHRVMTTDKRLILAIRLRYV
jgi:hypothetical protein